MYGSAIQGMAKSDDLATARANFNKQSQQAADQSATNEYVSAGVAALSLIAMLL
jgi:hypothetical protein